VHRRSFVFDTARAAVAFGVLRHLGGCRPAATSASVISPFVDLRDRYFVRFLAFNPVTSTYLGGDGYSPALKDANAHLRDYTPTGLDAERTFYRQVRDALAKIDPAPLSPAERIDHAVLGAQLAFLLHQLDDLRYHERSVDSYVAEPFRGVDWQIQGMQDGDDGKRGSETEWNAVVDRVRGIPAYLDAARTNLLAGIAAGNLPDRRMITRDGVAGSGANAEYFRKTLLDSAHGYLGTRPFATDVTNRLTGAATAAADAWDSFGQFLKTSYDPDEKRDRYVLGKPEYEWRLHTCLREPRTVDELYEYGAAQVALYSAKVFTVAEEVAREAKLPVRFETEADKRAGVRAVMQHLSADSPKNDDELFAWYREAGERAVAFGREQKLFDVPANYRLEVTPTPPVLRSTIDAAYYPAPPFKKTGVGRFYLTPTDNSPAALKLNNRASVADTAVHEGFPGHDWHYKFMTQHAAEISNIRWLTPGGVEDSASMWEDSMAAEGWALYSEELMAEPVSGRPHGFYTAAEHLYELQGQLLRAVRVRVDVGLHTGRMTYDEAVDYFTEHVSFHPKACAHAATDPTAKAICDQANRAIYRYSKWPTQAITYNLGKNAIIELRDAARRKAGAGWSAKSFHERLMKMGTIPAGYFRETFLTSAT
jgi:uncharacterized protein (DUF885 family)